jgi:hypothetical protein
MDKLLETILVTQRAHDSVGERAFINWLKGHLFTLGHKAEELAAGNLRVQVGDANKLMFSCHTDTCHNQADSNGNLPQKLKYDEDFGLLSLAEPKTACLGADDGAGVYVLLKMIEAKVQATYIFHRGEERGGIGSRALLAANPDLLKTFSHCIAFDRGGNDEVVVTQGGAICASTKCGTALATALATAGLPHVISHKGSFTDSKVYRELIPECLNVSVGYKYQHSPEEYLDVKHLEALVAVAVKLDWAALPVDRVAKADPAPLKYDYKSSLPRGKKQVKAANFDDAYDFEGLPRTPQKQLPFHPRYVESLAPKLTLRQEVEAMDLQSFQDWLCTEPDEVQQYVLELRLSEAGAKAQVKAIGQLLGLYA